LELDEELAQIVRRDADPVSFDIDPEQAAPSGRIRMATRPPGGVNLMAFDR
jgi:hypothetical protein